MDETFILNKNEQIFMQKLDSLPTTGGHRYATIRTLLSELTDCIEKGQFIAALYMAVCVPDICGCIAYPELYKKNGVCNRYKKWIKENIVDCKDINTDIDENSLLLFPTIWYAIRNTILHNGTINETFRRDEDNKTLSKMCKELQCSVDDVINDKIKIGLTFCVGPEELTHTSIPPHSYKPNVKKSETEHSFAICVNIKHYCQLLCDALSHFIRSDFPCELDLKKFGLPFSSSYMEELEFENRCKILGLCCN